MISRFRFDLTASSATSRTKVQLHRLNQTSHAYCAPLEATEGGFFYVGGVSKTGYALGGGSRAYPAAEFKTSGGVPPQFLCARLRMVVGGFCGQLSRIVSSLPVGLDRALLNFCPVGPTHNLIPSPFSPPPPSFPSFRLFPFFFLSLSPSFSFSLSLFYLGKCGRMEKIIGCS